MGQSNRGIFSVELPASQITLDYAKLTKISQHTTLPPFLTYATFYPLSLLPAGESETA